MAAVYHCLSGPFRLGILTNIVLRQIRVSLETYFWFQRLGPDWKTEVLAGFTTFITMAYIVFVNPSILKRARMPLAGSRRPLAIAAALGTLLMGAFALTRLL